MVIVDTDVIISSIRGNEMAKQLLRKYSPGIFISAVTQMELYIGATDKAKKGYRGAGIKKSRDNTNQQSYLRNSYQTYQIIQ